MTHIKQFKGLLNLLLLAMLFVATACNNDEVEEADIPQQIQDFVSKYFPGRAMSDFKSLGDDQYVVTVSNGPTMNLTTSTFFVNVNKYDGNGETMPAMLAQSQLPETLYNYLEQIDSTDSIYRMEKTAKNIIVDLFDTIVTYDNATHEIKQT